jgi:hypothetical protein
MRTRPTPRRLAAGLILLATAALLARQATVDDPGAPAATPTGPAASTVRPPRAVPKRLQTAAGRPVPVTLEGADPTGALVAFAIVEQPLNGQLTGTPPYLTYEPARGFVGRDRLTYKVISGAGESQPADVTVEVVAPGPVGGPHSVFVPAVPQQQPIS